MYWTSKRNSAGICRRQFVVSGFSTSCLFVLAVLGGTGALAQSVVPDGGSATIVVSGGVLPDVVSIAPANAASISHNTYSAFNVASNGVTLDNNTVAAQTIVNEVTSASPSLIEGSVTVIGQKADVILANPNGILVNGGRFLGTGNAALVTGRLSQTPRGVVEGHTTGGSISVAAGGLSGTMEELALISGTLRIDGPLQFDVPNADSRLNLITGQSRVSFDRQRGGFGQDGSGQLPWALVTQSGAGATNAVIVDITGNGSVSAGRINVTVTDRGAGVRFAGDQVAAAGGFRLSSTGRLEIIESSLTAQSSVNISAGEVALVSTEGTRAEITSEASGVTIAAGAGDIQLGQGRISGRIVASDNLASAGGVTLSATGRIFSENRSGRRAELVSDDTGVTNPQDTSNIVLAADGAMTLDGLRVIASDGFRATAGGPVSFSNTSADVGEDFRVFSNEPISFDATVVDARSDIRLEGASLRFGSDDVDQSRTELRAETGGLILRAGSGGIANFGSLLQGRNTPASDPDALGAVTMVSGGSMLNRSLSVSRLAVAFGEIDDLVVQVNGDVRNQTGRLFSNSGITITADGDIVNETLFTIDPQPFTVDRIVGGRFAGSLFLKRARTTVASADYGTQKIAGEQSFILGVGDVTLSARNILSVGADITGADVDITALESVVNEARLAGQVNFRQHCKWFCKTSGSSSLRFVGGTITASGDLALTAGESITSRSARMIGATDVVLTAPDVEMEPVFLPALIERPSGLTGLFHGRNGYLTGSQSFGSIHSTRGSITIDGDAVLRREDLFAAGGVVITGTRVESTLAGPQQMFEQRPLGLFWNLFK